MIEKKTSPYLFLIYGFAIVISIGTVLLLLPFATKEGYTLSFIDALFTSTSAVCVTGLLSVPSVSSVFTIFGKVVIILLVEIGGLGFVTIVMFIFTMLGLKIGMQDRFLIKESLNQNSLKGMVRLVKFTVLVTLTIQFVGAIINFLVFIKQFPFWRAVGVSGFHAISAFNNAGFDIFPEGLSMIPYQSNLLLNINTIVLIILGGIGFIVVNDLLMKRSWRKLSVHSKIVLKTSFFLIFFGMIIFKLMEGSKITWLQALFNSVSLRTAGFATINYNNFTSAAILIALILMFIGASPASTGGGIKTTTFYTIVKYIVSFGQGKAAVTHKRRIADNSIAKAFVLVTIAFSYVIVIIISISIVERFNPRVTVNSNYFIKIIFETFSAFGTVGTSMGITVDMHWFSKFLICTTMFFGRLGPITIISAWYKHRNNEAIKDIKYLEEKIIIG